jgi:hypothetical protein
MIREEYIKIRNSNSIDFELFYDYYTTHCKEPIIKTIEEFIPTFIQWLNTLINPMFTEVFEYYDAKFNITRIINLKTNQIIKYE